MFKEPTAFRTTADEDLLRNAQFDPVFDADGTLVDIVHLEITTDRSRGIRAMEELAASNMEGDHVVHADGWTGKWKRVLNTPAPGAAHSIKPSKRWNSALGEFVPSATLILPYEVVWTLFDRLFFGRYSIQVQELTFDSEDVVESSAEGARNIPGRVFYANAKVAITLHLENGVTRTYTGFGVSYDSVKLPMTGNVYTINSARRMVEKGAVSDAKREALASMGRVFNRAFEDGAQAMRAIEEKLLEKMRGEATSGSKAPRPVRVAPAPRKAMDPNDAPMSTQADNVPDDYVPMDAYDEMRAAESETSIDMAHSAAIADTVETDRTTAASESDTTTTDAMEAAPNDEDEGAAKPTAATTAQDAVALGPKPSKNAPAKSDAGKVKVEKTGTKPAGKAKALETTKPQKPTSDGAQAQGYTLSIGQSTQTVADADEAFQLVFDAVESAETTAAKLALLERNKVALLRAEKANGDVGFTYAELEAMARDEGQGAPSLPATVQAEEDEAIDEGLRIVARDDKGEHILRGYAKMFDAHPTRIDAILDANQDIAKKLTGKQRVELAKIVMDVRAKR